MPLYRSHDLIGRCFFSARELLSSPHGNSSTLTKSLLSDKGAFAGKVAFELTAATDEALREEKLRLPFSAADVAALTRVLWAIGIPKDQCTTVVKCVVLCETPPEVIQRLGVLRSFTAVQLCNHSWLAEVLRKWMVFAKAQNQKRNQDRQQELALDVDKASGKGPKSWNDRIKELEAKAQQSNNPVDMSSFANTGVGGAAVRAQENLLLAGLFARRTDPPVIESEKAHKLVDHFLSLDPSVTGGGLVGQAKETREMIAEMLANLEREAQAYDSVNRGMAALCKEVQDERGPGKTLSPLHSTLHTPHSTIHTPQSTIHTPHSTLHTLHSTLNTPHSILHTPHSILHTPP